jgi:hypothetical protein
MYKIFSIGLALAWLSACAMGCVPSLKDNPARDPYRALPRSFGREAGQPQASSSAQKA